MSKEETVAPDLIEKFAAKAHDLDAARGSVADAASVTTGLWLSYLFVLVYIGIAAGAVTHKDLFLENPVKLPFVSDVPLPLAAFFILAPIVFIVSHAYTLVHFVMLSAKVGVYNKELQKQLGDAAETKEYLRWQLPRNIFVQLLAGPAHLRGGWLGFLSKAIAWISLVIGPVFLLLLIQVQFLPFHSQGITWLHRGFILVDVILLWSLWPAVVDSGSEGKRPRRWRQKWLALSGSAAIGLAFTAATFPGEWLDEHIGNKQWIPANLVPDWDWLEAKDEDGKPKATSFHDLLFNGAYDAASQRRRSPFSNTLVLPGFAALDAARIDETKLNTVKQTITRKNGHFESAIFRGADLRKVDLQNAHLQGASLYQANLQGAQFYNANLQGTKLYQAKLQGASLADAQLQDAWLEEAQLQGATANSAKLQGASLKGAMLDAAQLQGARLDGTKLEGAKLYQAKLQGASLADAKLQGAWLEEAQLQGANAQSAHFQGASLKGAMLQGASLDDAELQGAALSGTLLAASPRETLKNALAANLRGLACSGGEDAPHIVRGLIANGRIKDTGVEAAGLVDAILKPDCPVSAALTDADKLALGKLKKEAGAGESKP